MGEDRAAPEQPARGARHVTWCSELGTQSSSSASDPPQQAAAAALPPPPRSLRRFDVGPRYRVSEVLGKGSYGQVCAAEDTWTGQEVAIKRVQELFDEFQDAKRILRELAILSKVEHPNIVKLLDVQAPGPLQTFDEIYLIMERCESDLRKLMACEVVLGRRHVQMLFYNLLLGLHYLHSAGIYHRDLKPANCLVNQDCTVKICDFGLARAMGEDAAASSSSEDLTIPPLVEAANGGNRRVIGKVLTGHVVTRWYRAPELILMQGSYTEGIDVWSAGCIFAELLGMLEGTRFEDRGPLFPGTCCFPLSPKEPGFHRLPRRRHQLEAIVELLGTPYEEEVERYDNEARRYFKSFGKRYGAGFRKKFPRADYESLEMLDRTLRFHPRERISVPDALELRFLTSVRREEKEVLAPGLLRCVFEKDPDLDEDLLRGYFGKEISKYRRAEARAATKQKAFEH